LAWVGLAKKNKKKMLEWRLDFFKKSSNKKTHFMGTYKTKIPHKTSFKPSFES
jgi:3-dehydroquinate dehydratase